MFDLAHQPGETFLVATARQHRIIAPGGKARGGVPADPRASAEYQEYRFVACHAALSLEMVERRLGERSDLSQCLLEIGDQIIRVFNPDRDAHEIVSDAERGLAFVGHREVRHRSRVTGQRLGPA